MYIDKRDTGGRGMVLGVLAEDRFVNLMQHRGWSVTHANERENKLEHWDYKIVKGQYSFKVDVKAQKRISRADRLPNRTWLWVELKNNFGYPGWAVQNKADYFAFERDNLFYLVSSANLARIVKSLVINEIVRNPAKAQYRIYSREGRSDALSLIRYADLASVANIIGLEEDMKHAKLIESAIGDLVEAENLYRDAVKELADAEWEYKKARASAYLMAEGTIKDKDAIADEQCWNQHKRKIAAEAIVAIHKTTLDNLRTVISARQSILSAEAKSHYVQDVHATKQT